MRIYLAGVGGMLGEALHKVLGEKHELLCTDIDVNAPWLSYSDFRDFADYEKNFSRFEPEILMHIGAHTDLEYCERNPDDAYRTNTLSVNHAITLANAHGIPLVYISTAGIFDGTKALYDDWDQPNPLGVYARAKYMGEVEVLARANKHYIFRAGWMMGGGPAKDKKFISKLMKQLAAGATTLNIVDDKLGTPTYTIDFARTLGAMVETPYYGLYNMVCGGETGRLEVAEELIRLLKLESKVKINSVQSEYFSSEYFAPRPPCERLYNYKLKLRGMDLMRDWRVALKDYIATYYADHVKPFAPDYQP
ncbi:dTDP-4-dehydrorhamnose reductase [Rhizomicrobium palustre]|uniref:dTDP-4-dehydrorhamnose reductase n=1 Tax=Rhizomicrobium palustre TaxID=189966 RepID=A0A846MYR3_9PROT|nr:NAD(P)-dependent oxidoreductase [Rhizomicrobium palustre]NIK88355.1 dTDP-4-dehydrorhamnose reductase [Rhizomicrobium palustre]